MKKQFKTNLGSVDAKAFGLDFAKCHKGDVVDLTEDQVKAITEKYPLMLLDPDSDEAVEVRAVAKPAAITAPATPATFADNPHDTKKKDR